MADRADCRTLLIRYHLLATLPPLALGVVIASHSLSHAVLIVYGLAMGTLSALVIPARVALLTRVISRGLGRAVAVTTATELIAQMLGIMLAGLAGAIGAVSLLVAQAITLALGALAVSRLSAAPSQAVHAPARVVSVPCATDTRGVWRSPYRRWPRSRMSMSSALACGGSGA